MQPKQPSNDALAALGVGAYGDSGLPYMTIGQFPHYTNKLFRQYFMDQVLLPLVSFRVYQRSTDTALQYSVMAGKVPYGDTEVSYAGTTAEDLTPSATNYIYLTTAGTLVKNTTGFPVPSVTPHMKLAEYVTTATEIASFIDYRDTAIFGFGGSGETDNITVYNDTGSEIAAGKLLYISGYDSTNACYEVSLADADDPNKPAQLIANETIANASTGEVVKKYDLAAQDTSGSTVGDPVYLSATAGEWTATAPTGDSQTKQEIGVITSVNATTGTVRLYCGYAGGAERIDISALPAAIQAFFSYAHSIGGIFTSAGAFTLAGAFDATVNLTGPTNITLPTSGTLMNNSLADAKIFVGSAGGVATGVTVTGDVTITNAGVTSIGNDKVTLAMLNSGVFNVPYGIPQLDADGNLVGPVMVRYDTLANLEAIVLGAGELAVASDTNQILVGDDSTSGGWAIGCDDATIVVRRGSTNTISGTNLLAAYTAAKALTPGGAALSDSNKARVVVPPGTYDLGTTPFALDIDTDYVDVVSLGCICRRKDRDTIQYPPTVIQGACYGGGTAYYSPVKVSARNCVIAGIRFVNDMTGSTSNYGGCVTLSNANGADAILFENCGFKILPAHSSYTSGLLPNTNVMSNILATLNQCHSNTSLCKEVPFDGNAYDCSSTNGRSFTPSNGSSTGRLVRLQSYNRDWDLSNFAGIMDDCVIEVTATGKNAVTLGNNYVGATARTDDGTGTTSTIVLDAGDVTAEFPVGAYVVNMSDMSVHKIITSEFATKTTVTVSPAASTSFAGATSLHAYKPTQIYNSTLITLDTASVGGYIGFLARPLLMCHCRVNYDIATLAKNQIATPYNVIDTDLYAAYKDFE